MGSPCCKRCENIEKERGRQVLTFADRGIPVESKSARREGVPVEPYRFRVALPAEGGRHLAFDLR